MEASDAFEIALGELAGEFLGEGGNVFFGEQRRLLRGGRKRAGTQKSAGDQDAIVHASSGGRGILAEIGEKNGARLRWESRGPGAQHCPYIICGGAPIGGGRGDGGGPARPGE